MKCGMAVAVSCYWGCFFLAGIFWKLGLYLTVVKTKQNHKKIYLQFTTSHVGNTANMWDKVRLGQM